MGVLSWLRGPAPRAEAREYLGGSFLPFDYIVRPGMEVSGVDEALRISTVWACVNLIANHIATMPYEAYRRDARGVPSVVTPRPRLIDKPHPDLNRVDWLTMVMTSLLLHGNAYLAIVDRDLSGYPTALLPLDTGQVTVNGKDGRAAYTIGGKPVDAADLIHIRGLTQPGRFVGLSVIDHARTTMGASLATDRFASEYFSEGMAPSGVLQVADDLDPADADELARGFESRHGRSRRPVVLTMGTEWKPLSVSPEESQFLATREFQVHDIARLFGVPGHMIGALDKTTAFGAGIQALNTSFHMLTLQPWLVRLETALTDQLPRGQYVKAVTASMLRGTVTERYAAYSVALANGLMCIDEMRALEDLPPLPDGQGAVFYVPSLLVPAAKALETENPDDTDAELDNGRDDPTDDGTPTGPNGTAPAPVAPTDAPGQILDPAIGDTGPTNSD